MHRSWLTAIWRAYWSLDSSVTITCAASETESYCNHGPQQSRAWQTRCCMLTAAHGRVVARHRHRYWRHNSERHNHLPRAMGCNSRAPHGRVGAGHHYQRHNSGNPPTLMAVAWCSALSHLTASSLLLPFTTSTMYTVLLLLQVCVLYSFKHSVQ